MLDLTTLRFERQPKLDNYPTKIDDESMFDQPIGVELGKTTFYKHMTMSECDYTLSKVIPNIPVCLKPNFGKITNKQLPSFSDILERVIDEEILEDANYGKR